jgi:hypothetical protein
VRREMTDDMIVVAWRLKYWAEGNNRSYRNYFGLEGFK